MSEPIIVDCPYCHQKHFKGQDCPMRPAYDYATLGKVVCPLHHIPALRSFRLDDEETHAYYCAAYDHHFYIDR